jgi:putative membrane protein (TIGR04086 family)
MKRYDVGISVFLKSAGIGAVISHVSSLLLILIAALIVSSCDANETVIGIISLAILCATAFLGGFFAARILKCKALFVGLVSGAFYYLSLALVSAAISADSFGKMVLLKLVLTAVFSALGGIVTTLKEKTVV